MNLIAYLANRENLEEKVLKNLLESILEYESLVAALFLCEDELKIIYKKIDNDDSKIDSAPNIHEMLANIENMLETTARQIKSSPHKDTQLKEAFDRIVRTSVMMQETLYRKTWEISLKLCKPHALLGFEGLIDSFQNQLKVEIKNANDFLKSNLKIKQKIFISCTFCLAWKNGNNELVKTLEKGTLPPSVTQQLLHKVTTVAYDNRDGFREALSNENIAIEVYVKKLLSAYRKFQPENKEILSIIEQHQESLSEALSPSGQIVLDRLVDVIYQTPIEPH